MGVKEDVKNSGISYLRPYTSSKEEIHKALEDSEFAEYVVSNNDPFEVMNLIPDDIKENNPNLYVIAMKNDIRYAHYVPHDVKIAHPEVFLDRLNESIELRKNGELLNVREGITEAIQGMPESMQSKYIETIAKATEQEPRAIWALTDKVKEENPEICLKAVEADLGAFDYLPMSIKEKNPELCLKYAKEHKTILGIPEDVLIQHPELVAEEAKRDPLMFMKAESRLPEELLKNEDIKKVFEIQKENFEKEHQKSNFNKENNRNEKNESSIVKTNKFREIYNNTRGRLKQAFNKFKEAFSRENQNNIDKTEINNDTNDREER